MPGFPPSPKMLQLIKDLHDNTTCAIEADKRDQDSWCPVSTASEHKDVNVPAFFNILLESISRSLEVTKGERLGPTWEHNVNGHLTSRHAIAVCPSMSYCMHMKYKISKKNGEQTQSLLAMPQQAAHIEACR